MGRIAKLISRALLLAGLLAALCPADSTQVNPGGAQSAAEYDSAYRLLESGKTQEAINAIDAALAHSPRSPALYNLRGLAKARLGKIPEAESAFRKVIELQPRAALGYNNLATLLAQSGRLREAVDSFRAALKLEPRNFSALIGISKTLTALREFAQAKPCLEAALAVKPGDFEAALELARVQRELKDTAAAQKTFAQIRPPVDAASVVRYYSLAAMLAEDRGDAEAALKSYRRAHEFAPQSFEIYVSLARAFVKHLPESAADALPSPPAHLSSEQHFALGLLFASHNLFREAIPQFEETLRLEPASYSAAFNLVIAYRGAGQIQEATQIGRKILKERPTAELHNLVASLEETAGDYLNAVRDYQRAVELEPTNEQYTFDLGMEYLVHFTFDPAQEVFRVGTQRFPSSVRQHVGLGYAHYGVRQYLEAAEAFLTALEIDPTSPAAFAAWNSLPAFLGPTEFTKILPRVKSLAEHYQQNPHAQYCYGVLLLRRGQVNAEKENLRLAQPLLERAIQLNPEFADAHLELGNLYATLKEHAKAAVEFTEAARLSPRSEMAHYRLGQTYRNLNQLERAQKELAEYTELTRDRRELMARSRAAIKQFVLAQSGSPTEGSRTRPKFPHDPQPSER
ncbi:MAG: tetratricopeptide repeat protein [Terriglobia bacterium]